MVACVWVRALWCACVAATVAALCPPCPPAPPPSAHAPAPAGRACTALGSATADECFYHIDQIADDFYYNTAPGYFGLKCVEGLTLEEPALPAFPSPVAVPTVALWGCGPPGGAEAAGGAGGYAAALARLNVSALDRLLLLQLPPRPPLRAAHLAGLASLRSLHISARDIVSHPVVVDAADESIFSTLLNLETLKLEGVKLPAGALENIKAENLTSLEVWECGVRSVPAALCARRRLARLHVRDAALRALRSACNVSDLSLAAPGLSALPALHSVVQLTLTVREAIKLEGCESLTKLTVTLTDAAALPAEWLAPCGRLRELRLRLRLRLPRGAALGNRTLRGARALRTLSIESNHSIRELEAGFFHDTRNIETLILSRNNFTEFPIDLFAPLTRLRTLDLSHNALRGAGGGGGGGGALEPLAGLPLRRLLLDRNPLGDLCPLKGDFVVVKQRSRLQGLPELEQLSLQGTGAARLCPDWRDLPLAALDLRSNNITELRWEDLSWRRRDHQTEVFLADNPLTYITVDQSEYKAASHEDNVMVKFILDDMDSERSLRCDCHMYWFALALRDGVVGVRFENLRCDAPSAGAGDGGAVVALGGEERATAELYERSLPFSQVKPTDMVCPLDSEECPDNCTCSLSPAAGGALVSCGGPRVALPALWGVARALPAGARLAVRAAGAGLRALPAALPPALAELDLRHNALRALPPAPAAALLAAGRRVLLRGNPLLCGCGEPLLLQIRDHQDQVKDLESVKCSDGRSVMQALREGCEETGAGPGVWAAGGGALALLSASALSLALRRAVRLRLKAFLLARGLCLRWARPSDADPYRYDAFLSYAHEDSAVAAQLLAELEGGGGGGGLRLCVHHRDWRAGGWIPQQIAESVAASRRTVVLLSDAFVRSGWARAEFREAHARALQDGAARLLVVLLGAAPPEGLDPEMRRYVAMHTYVRWGEPAFWDKLRAALPAPRPPRAAHGNARRNQRPRPQAPAAAAPTPTSPSPNSPAQQPPQPQPPPTPIVKFAQIDFPTPQKPLNQETSPCA